MYNHSLHGQCKKNDVFCGRNIMFVFKNHNSKYTKLQLLDIIKDIDSILFDAY